MASKLVQINKQMTCSVCLEVFKTPKMLPCLHSFCKECLEEVTKTCIVETEGKTLNSIMCSLTCM